MAGIQVTTEICKLIKNHFIFIVTLLGGSDPYQFEVTNGYYGVGGATYGSKSAEYSAN
jgi:hypothetical protein